MLTSASMTSRSVIGDTGPLRESVLAEEPRRPSALGGAGMRARRRLNDPLGIAPAPEVIVRRGSFPPEARRSGASFCARCQDHHRPSVADHARLPPTLTPTDQPLKPLALFVSEPPHSHRFSHDASMTITKPTLVDPGVPDRSGH